MSKRTVPEVRFLGFSGEWVNKGLKERATFSKGYGFSKSDLVNEGFPIILYGRLYTKYETIISEVDTFIADNSNAVISNGDEVIVPASGETAEDISRASVVGRKGIVLGGDLNIIYPDKDIIPAFLAISISNGAQQREMMKRAQGKSVVHLHNSDLCEVKLTYPAQLEQSKIGEFFKNLDDLIAQNQKKYGKLVNMKKACLDKMFPKEGTDTPEVRFQGFCGEWVRYSLKSYTKYRRGSFPQPYGNKEWYDGDDSMPFVQVVDVADTLSLSIDTKQRISKMAQSKSVFVLKGTVVVTLQGSIGRVAITQYDAYVDRTILIFTDYAEQTNQSFWAYTIQLKFDIEKQRAPGGTIKTITKEALSSFEVYIPPFAEQTKIGTFFQTIDNLITLQKTELEKLKNIKRACLDKMFI